MARRHADSRAHARVSQAVRSGRLAKPARCESCLLRTDRLQAHHDDYSEPLRVRWLCVPCHRQWHTVNGPGANTVERSRSEVKLRLPEALHGALMAEAKERGSSFNALVSTVLTHHFGRNHDGS